MEFGEIDKITSNIVIKYEKINIIFVTMSV